MSYPKKTKGWRKLVLDNQQFRWNFAIGAEKSLLKLQDYNSSARRQAVIILPEWRNPWLFFRETGILPNEPKIVLPEFAGRAIKFALRNGWNPEESGPAINFEYKEGNFALLK